MKFKKMTVTGLSLFAAVAFVTSSYARAEETQSTETTEATRGAPRGGGNHGGGSSDHGGGGNHGGESHQPSPGPQPGHENHGNAGGGNHQPTPPPAPSPQPGHENHGNIGGGNHQPTPAPAPSPQPGHENHGTAGTGNNHQPGGSGPFPPPHQGGHTPAQPGQSAHGIGVNPHNQVTPVNPAHLVNHQHPSHMDNPLTQQNVHVSNDLSQNYRTRYPAVASRIETNGNTYFNNYNSRNHERWSVVNNYYGNNSYRYYYSGYFAHGFYGGYFYPVRPCFDIQTNFWYPSVYWLYASEVDQDFYRVWYPHYNQYPVEVFRYARVFYPTDTLRDLGIEVSALPEFEQYNFRRDMEIMTESIQSQLGSLTLDDDEIVVNHYQNLNNRALVLEGFVDKDDLHVAFKAYLDLRNVDQTVIFVPRSENPTAADINTLDNVINPRIVSNGGNPLVADEEPVQ